MSFSFNHVGLCSLFLFDPHFHHHGYSSFRTPNCSFRSQLLNVFSKYWTVVQSSSQTNRNSFWRLFVLHLPNRKRIHARVALKCYVYLRSGFDIVAFINYFRTIVIKVRTGSLAKNKPKQTGCVNSSTYKRKLLTDQY